MTDDVQMKLATLEGQLAGVPPALQRIEEQLQRLVALDRTVAELAVRQSHSVDAISHIRERIDENRNVQIAADVALTKRIDDTGRDAARFENRVQGALYVIAALLTVAATCAGWLLNQVSEMSRAGAVQEQRLAAAERELARLTEHKKMSLLYVPPKPAL